METMEREKRKSRGIVGDPKGEAAPPGDGDSAR